MILKKEPMRVMNRLNLGIYGLFTILFLFVNCADAQKKKGNNSPLEYTITAKLSGDLVPTQVFLGELYNSRISVLDTSEQIQGDSVIQFKGQSNESLMGFIMLSERVRVPVVIEPGSHQEFVIQTKGQAIQYEVTGKGYEGSLKIRQILEENAKHEYELSKIENLFRSGQVSPAQGGEMQAQYSLIRKELDAMLLRELGNEAQPLASYFVFNAFLQEPDADQFKALLGAFETTLPNSKYYTEVQNKYRSISATLTGAVAPEINLPNPEGDSIKLSSLRGKVVLLDFWASWCRPCRMENPNVKKVYEKYKDQGFEIYAVSLDGDKQSWEGAIRADGLPWVHVSDLAKWSSVAAKTYQVRGIPYTVLLDPEGKILAKNLRGEQLEAFLEEYFKG